MDKDARQIIKNELNEIRLADKDFKHKQILFNILAYASIFAVFFCTIRFKYLYDTARYMQSLINFLIGVFDIYCGLAFIKSVNRLKGLRVETKGVLDYVKKIGEEEYINQALK